MAVSVKELTAELKSLKKRLYAFQFKGLELQERARSHLIDHRLAELAGRSDAEEVDESSSSSRSISKAFGSAVTPLSNEYILEMVASYLPLQDLRSCRQVCKLWAKELRRCTHKRKSLVVAYEDDCGDAEEILKSKRQGNYINISTLVVLEIPLESRIVQDLLFNFGNTMSGLKLDDCSPTAQEIYSALRSIPCLESFSVKTSLGRLRPEETSLLDQITSDAFEPKLRLPFLKKLVWEEVSRPVLAFERVPELCPNLVFLKLYSVGPCRPQKFEDLQWNTLQNLTLKADDEFKSCHFESLSKLQLNLEKLKLYNIKPGGKKKVEKLSEFLESQRNTLVEITLSDLATYHSETDDVFLQDYTPLSDLSMPHLKNAKIDFGFIVNLGINNLPALTRLDCKARFWRNWWKVLFKKTLPSPHPLIQEISLGAIDNECLQRIAASFPNLTKLEVSEDRIGDWALRTICRSMTKLTSLRIMKSQRDKTCPTITDAGITGFTPEDCDRLSVSQDYSSEAANNREYPFIGDLINLRVLELETSTESKLSDISIMCGISKLTNLVILALPKCDITDTAWKAIESLPNIYINEVGGARKYFRSQDHETPLDSRSYKELFADID